jgi:hypothetical protein
MTEIASRQIGWTAILPLPVVVDADVLSRSVDHALLHGYRPAVVSHASPSYTSFTGITLFATDQVVGETFRRFDSIAKSRGAAISEVERTWDELFCARVRVVDMTTITTNDPRVADVAARDKDDESTAKLAVMLAPCALLTDNWEHFQAFRERQQHPTRAIDTTTAYALDVRDLGEFLQMVNAGTLPPRLAGAAMFEGGKALVGWVGRDRALLIALLLLGGAALYLTSERGREVRARVIEAARELAAEHGPAIGAAFESGVATAERLTAFAVQPGEASAVTLVGRELAARAVLTTVQVADQLLSNGYCYTPASEHRKRVRAWLTRESCFWEGQRGQWTLGYHLQPLAQTASAE